MSKRNPTLPDNARLDQFDDFPLGHNSVGEVQPPIFPLHRAVQIQSVTQPVIWWTPDRITRRSTTKTVMSFCKNPAKAKMNLMKMGGGEKSCIPGLKLFGTQWVWNIFNGVTQTVSVVIGRIDAPAKKDKASSLGIHCCEKRCCGFFYLYHSSPVRWCGVYFIRYATGSIFPSSMTIFILRVASPSANRPFFILSNSTSDSSMGRSLHGDWGTLWPFSSSPFWWHTYAWPLKAEKRNESNTIRAPTSPHILHSPPNKIHSKVIELLKIVRSVCDGIRFVACVSKTVIWQWLHECRECAQEHQNIYAQKTYPATPPYPWWQWSISPLPSQDLCHHTSGSKFHYLPMGEHNV